MTSVSRRGVSRSSQRPRSQRASSAYRNLSQITPGLTVTGPPLLMGAGWCASLLSLVSFVGVCVLALRSNAGFRQRTQLCYRQASSLE